MSDRFNGNSTPPAMARPGVLSLNIREKAALYAAYMPYLKGGGIFIPTNRQYQLGEEVFMLLSLMDDPQRIAVQGKVVWITPEGVQGNRTQGIGRIVQRTQCSYCVASSVVSKPSALRDAITRRVEPGAAAPVNAAEAKLLVALALGADVPVKAATSL